MQIRTILAATAAALLLAGCATPTVNSGSVSNASGAAPSATAADSKTPPTWGQRYTWPSGVAIEVGAPAECKPNAYAQPPNIQRAVLLQVTVVNGSDKPVDTTLLSVANATFAGERAESVTDSGGKCEDSMLSAGTVLPGKTLKLKMAFAVGKEKGELQVEFQGDIGGDKAVFVGQA